MGNDTDMFILGPQLGTYDRINSAIVAKLDEEFQKIKQKQTVSLSEAQVELKNYVDNLTSANATTQADKPSPEDTQKPDSDGREAKPS